LAAKFAQTSEEEVEILLHHFEHHAVKQWVVQLTRRGEPPIEMGEKFMREF